MRLFSKWSLPAVLVSVVVISTAFAADVKIGIVDFERVFEESTAGKAIRAEFTTKGQQLEADFKKKGAEFETFKKNLEREALVMDKDMMAKKRAEYEAKVNELQDVQRGYQGELQSLQQRLMGSFQKEVADIVQQIAKSGNYTLVMEKRGGGVVYAAGGLDITDEVIKRHNALKPKKGK